ncbi:PLP-dependent transferase [Candidatus Saccharibacteria bacterium]|nr:MAG: PLP-dependent transferase [Candidatus Saccharibacteria bacterium]
MYTQILEQIPLGTPIPDNTPHAVSVSLPTMEDVQGFRYGDPAVHDKLRTSYPRFGIHPLVKQALAHILADPSGERSVLPVSNTDHAEAIITRYELDNASIAEYGPLTVIGYATNSLKTTRAARYLRATGGVASSRRAEQYLVGTGELAAPHLEATASDNPAAHITNQLQSLYPGRRLDIRLANSGMSSIYALAQGVAAANPKRDEWVLFGGVYADTAPSIGLAGGKALEFEDITDYDSLAAYLEAHSEQTAAIFTEAPTNPLLQTADLDRLADLASRYDVPLVIDVAVAGSAAVDVSPYADIIIESLTKFASGHGDMMMGVLLFNKSSQHYEALASSTTPFIDAPFSGDLARMAYEIDGYRERVHVIGERTLQVIEFLERQPEIGAIHWTGSPTNQADFATITRDADHSANIFTIVPKSGLAPLYDALPAAKGASFGIADVAVHTPYVQLAHPEKVDFPEGLATLAHKGLHPDMLRVSVSARPVDEQIAAYEAAFEQLRK